MIFENNLQLIETSCVLLIDDASTVQFLLLILKM